MAPESSWPHAPSHVFPVLQNPESFEIIPNHSGIIVESYLNHLLREPKQWRLQTLNHAPSGGWRIPRWLAREPLVAHVPVLETPKSSNSNPKRKAGPL